jgi:sporulation protein YlmC with PRC-barrel domain
MNVMKLTSVICGGMISLAGGSLLAQSSSQTSSSPNYGSSGTAATTSGQWMRQGKSIRLSDLMDATVQGQDGKTLGYIRDFTVHPQSGRVQFAILSTTPVEGAASAASSQTVPSSRASLSANSSSTTSTLTGKLIPIPWPLFSQSLKNENLGGTAAAKPALVLNNIDESKLQRRAIGLSCSRARLISRFTPILAWSGCRGWARQVPEISGRAARPDMVTRRTAPREAGPRFTTSSRFPHWLDSSPQSAGERSGDSLRPQSAG